MLSTRLTLVAVPLVALLLAALPADANTFVFPHLLESSGIQGPSNFSFDTTIYLTHAGGLDGTQSQDDAVVATFTWTQSSGAPVESDAGIPVCNPCSFSLNEPGISGRRVKIQLSDLVLAAGGASQRLEGYGVLVLDDAGTGAAANVAVTAETANIRSGPGDVAVFVFEPQPVSAAAKRPLDPRAILKSYFETASGVGTSGAVDNHIHAVYGAGLGEIPTGSGANLSIYVYDESGTPLRSAAQTDVCNPCDFPLDATSRAVDISLQTLVDDAGGLAADGCGFIVAWITGDAENVFAVDVTLNSQSGPNDVNLWGDSLTEIPAATTTTSVVPGQPLPQDWIESLTNYPNPFNPRTSIDFRLRSASQVRIDIQDTRGRRVRTLEVGTLGAGTHHLQWDGLDRSGHQLPSGVYYARVQANDATRVRKMTLVR